MAKSDTPTFKLPVQGCHNCRKSGEQGPALVCRAKPPVPVLMMQMGLDNRPQQVTAGLFPPVSNYDWCAEWTAKLSG